ncbi:MAG: pilus (MSHA type) biogenesis protein MshL [Rhodocyclaceae bacterium]|jgi:MSHA biogenesis protein MshL|nr:pilus (MSHA type) biogenesis protein MshL [Rhodocyclaceae bacterium]
MMRILGLAATFLLAGCQMMSSIQPGAVRETIGTEMQRATENRNREAAPDAVSRALMPPLTGQIEAPAGRAVEPRFDLSVSNASASQVFMAIVSGTRYSMLVNPEVTGSISVNLKDVTVMEALDTIRELYGYEYRVQGTRIFVQPLSMQSKVFKVNYLTAQRQGRSDTRVVSGSITASTAGTAGAAGTATPATGAAGTTTQPAAGSSVSTTNSMDFWGEINEAIKAIIGVEGGRSVVISPQSGVIVVRAMPRELREVENFLRASQLTIERQVMLEAKIVEVVLSEQFQAGINWAGFTATGRHRLSSGANVSQFKTQAPSLGVNQAGEVATQYNTDSGSFVANDLGNILAAPLAGAVGRLAGGPLAGIMGLAFQTGSFAALISFLETQGSVHVLSSPRIATINNQKAVLKVGTDDFYVTNISTTTSSSGSSTTTSPTITVQPFFSGISLDVMPQIDEGDNIILHVRPSVSVVSERNKVINLGTLGTFQLPLASSSINETDSIVRVRDGNIVAIGGLMEYVQTDDGGKVPGVGDVPGVNAFFRQGKKGLQKREIVVLLKPTVIHGDKQWEQDLVDTRERLRAMERPLPQPAQ